MLLLNQSQLCNHTHANMGARNIISLEMRQLRFHRVIKPHVAVPAPHHVYAKSVELGDNL